MITIPNILSILRICATIIFLVTFYLGYIVTATGILIFSVLTDLLDGFLARTLKQTTVLGSFLDPLADKLLVDVTFLIFVFRGYIPWWVFTSVLLRDSIIVIGWIVMKIRYKNSIITFTRYLGKVTVFFQMLTLVIVVFYIATAIKFFSVLRPIFFILTTVLSIISMIDNIIFAKKIVGINS